MNISEESFVSWSQGPGKTEAEKCENAENAVKKAIAADEELAALDISVSPQGSYLVRTNIRQDSDVDNTYRIDADVVAAFKHRRYTGNKNQDGTDHFHEGVAFLPDGGSLIKNWPQQTYDNGVARNDETGRCYKRTIRIFKRLRNKMQEDNISEAANIASFLIECLVWNAPLEAFQHDTYTEVVRQVIIGVWNPTKSDESCSKWVEINRLKWLFRPSQPWTRLQAHQFMQAAWTYIGYK